MAEQEQPLAVLRARIDAIDRDLMQLLAQRMAVVSEVASTKRQAGVPIRDRQREQQVLEERRRLAEELSLPSATVESLYRMILLASRDHQAALRAELPPHTEPVTVAVIGGRGGMGALLSRLFADLGHAVLVADLDTDITPAQAASSADVVIVSVPIDATVQVIREVGPKVRKDAVLVDVTSVKQEPVHAMLEATQASQASVVGTHPMFGPNVHTLQGQRVVICPARGERWAKWLERMLTARGLTLVTASPEHHDRVMAVVQVLAHFQTEIFGWARSKLGVSLEESLRFSSPIYLMELYLAARHFAQDADLYRLIQMQNPEAPQVARVVAETARELASTVETGDAQRFHSMFEEVRDFFGPFTGEALERSSYLIDRLVERS